MPQATNAQKSHPASTSASTSASRSASEPAPVVTTFKVGKSKKASKPTDANTLKLVAKPITQGGVPNVVNDNFERAIASAKQGGEPLQGYFDAMNKTADFWGFMAKNTGEHQNPFVPGTDAQGNPIMMASSGNVDMRYGAFYRGPEKAQAAEGDDVPVVGIATLQTGETTYGLTKTLSFGLEIAGIPPGLILGSKLFKSLIQPLYKNIKTWATKNARRMEEEAEVEDPAVDPDASGDATADDATDSLEEGGDELIEEGVEYISINWGASAVSFAGLGVLAAIPFVLQYISHKMVVSVSIVNKTEYDFNWEVAYQKHGKMSVGPAPQTKKVIPKMSTYTDTWGDETSVKAAYEANFQFINSNNLGDIGNLITLEPVSTEAAGVDVLTAIPFDGENTIWVGESSGSPKQTYAQHSDATGQLSVSHNVGAYKVTSSITKLRGKTDDQYFYGVMVVIE